MKKIFVFTILILCFKLNAQNTKGLSVAKQEQQKEQGKTYALIVGISKYKDHAIPPLEFADRDAIAFYNYLIAEGVDSNSTHLLINENAKNGNIWMSIASFADSARQGDKIYIYFSGHGDVESRTLTEEAYLLPYDAPPTVYAAGAINIDQLKNYIATLSSKGARVIFICDACRSGNLAGGREGMQAAANVLKGVWKDEIKILSCQPGELSIEGKQWGNGRGLFSFELINGLAGLADRDRDGSVTVHELNLFLEENVHDEAKPLPQNPMVIGNREVELSKINHGMLAGIEKQKPELFASIETRGIENTLLKNQPDSIKTSYALFKANLDSGQLGYDDDKQRNAFIFLKKIPEVESTKLLIGLMKRNLAAKMINDINRIICEAVNNRHYSPNGFAIETVDYSSELLYCLGQPKLLALGLQSKLLYMKAVDSNEHNLLDSVLKIDASASYASGYYSIALNKIKMFDASKCQAINAIKVSPKFKYPYRALADDYLNLNMPDSCIYYAQQLQELDSTFNNVDANCSMACAYFLKNNIDSSDFYFMKMYRSDNREWSNKNSCLSKADLLFNLKKYVNAIPYYLVAKEMNSRNNRTTDTYEHSEHVSIYNKGSISGISNIDYQLACCYAQIDKTDSSIFYFSESLKQAVRNFKTLKRDPYFKYYASALNEGYSKTNNVQLDPALNPIRQTHEFKSLMKKYFPNQYEEK